MAISSHANRVIMALIFLTFAGFAICAHAQNLPPFPGLPTPPNDWSGTQGSDTVSLSSGMFAPFLPKIPNLELGYQYHFGKKMRTGRFTADYVLPFQLSSDSVLFAEAHAEGWDIRTRSNSSRYNSPGNRVDLSLGGGYRTMLSENTLVGVNAFYDASRIFSKWSSAGGVGFEMAANAGGNDAVDLNFNWYGNMLSRDVLINSFRNGGGSFDLEAGYSHALLNQALDLRLKLIGYKFDTGGNPVYGWRGGADLTTRDGLFRLRYEHGTDRVNGDYNTIGGFVTVGFSVETLLQGKNPFGMPTPVFESPRNLRRGQRSKVKRRWINPTLLRFANSTDEANDLCPPMNGSIHLAVDDGSPSHYHYVSSLETLTAADVEALYKKGAFILTWRGLTTLSASAPARNLWEIRIVNANGIHTSIFSDNMNISESCGTQKITWDTTGWFEWSSAWISSFVSIGPGPFKITLDLRVVPLGLWDQLDGDYVIDW